MTDAEQKSNVNGGGASDENFVQIFLINVDIIKAQNLIKADAFGKSDPYCKVLANGKSHSTKTIMKTLNPTWNESTQMCYFNDPQKLRFEVYDWDKHSKDDEIGDCELSLKGFYEPHHKGWPAENPLTLLNVKKGILFVRVQARKLVPDKLETRVSNLQQKTTNQQQSIQDSTNQIARLNQENQTLTDDNAQLTSNNEQLTVTKKDAETALAELNTEDMNLRTEIDRLSGISDGMTAQLDEVKGERDLVVQQLNGEKEKLSTAEQATQDLNRRLEDARRRLQEKRDAKERARRQREAEAEAEAQAQEAEQKRLREQAEAAKKEAAEKDKQKQESPEVKTPLMQQEEEKPNVMLDGTTAKGASDEAENQRRNDSGCQCCVIL